MLFFLDVISFWKRFLIQTFDPNEFKIWYVNLFESNFRLKVVEQFFFHYAIDLAK